MLRYNSAAAVLPKVSPNFFAHINWVANELQADKV
jgi:hypothetical protein